MDLRQQFLRLLLLLPMVATGLSAQEKVEPVAETSKFVEKIQLRSKVFGNTRTIRVLLPPGYHETQNRYRRYPVVYLNDGVMVFHAFEIEKQTHELIDSKTIKPIIFVGIDNGGSTDKAKNPDTDRAYEFLPYPDVGFAPDLIYEPDPPNPAGMKYPQFLDEVRALVDAKYRTKTGPENTGVGGFSYGGVAALYAAMHHPDIYGMLLLESTPLWIGEDLRLLAEAEKVQRWPRKIYIGLGSNESPEAKVNNKGRELHEQLVKYLAASKSKPKVTFRIADGAKHQPKFWAQRFPDALRFLFGE